MRPNHAVHRADGLRHDEVLAVDDVGGNALDLAHVVARLPGVGKRLHVGVLAVLREFVGGDAGGVKTGLQEGFFAGRPAFALLVISLVDRVLGLLEEGLRVFEVRDARGLVLHEAVGEELGTGAAVLALRLKVEHVELQARGLFHRRHHLRIDARVVLEAEGAVVGPDLDELAFAARKGSGERNVVDTFGKGEGGRNGGGAGERGGGLNQSTAEHDGFLSKKINGKTFGRRVRKSFQKSESDSKQPLLRGSIGSLLCPCSGQNFAIRCKSRVFSCLSRKMEKRLFHFLAARYCVTACPLKGGFQRSDRTLT